MIIEDRRDDIIISQQCGSLSHTDESLQLPSELQDEREESQLAPSRSHT